ncbi:MAG: selenide, water dikinase SelD [bacterium]|nr:selenide, water dikinase SelD [bacterium]
MWSNVGARAGDILLLTKPLGMGILTTALKNELVTAEQLAPAVQWMKTLNKHAQLALSECGIQAATDITGNGLLGHAAEIARASHVQFRIQASALPVIELALPLAEQGKVPGGTKMNKLYLGDYVRIDSNVSSATQWLMYDAQTSGGLLVCVQKENLSRAVANLRTHNVFFAEIGEVTIGAGIEVEN